MGDLTEATGDDRVKESWETAKAFADLRAGKLKMQCAVCGVDQGGCDCWTKCRTFGCTWSYRKGTSCPNCK